MSLATYDIRKLQFFRARIKETNRGRLCALAFVFCATFILGAVEINHDVGIYDEGIMLTGAMRVVQGALPHRDFYANYGPGQFFTLAAIFKLFGPSILVERIWDLVVKAGIACLVNVIASNLMGRLFATAVTAACILWLAVLGFPSYPVWPSHGCNAPSANSLASLPILDWDRSCCRAIIRRLCGDGYYSRFHFPNPGIPIQELRRDAFSSVPWI